MKHTEIEKAQMNYLKDLSMQEYRDSYNYKTMRKAIELCGSGNKILDVGCGSGLLGKILIDNGNEVYGVEIHDEQVKLSRRRGLVVRKARAQQLPFPDEMFDVVLMAEVIEHFIGTDKALAEIRRVLKPGGKIIITTPNFASLRDRMLVLFGKLQAFAQHSDHVKFFNKERLVRVMRKAKFRNIRVFGSCLGIAIPKNPIQLFFLDGLLPATWMQCLIAEGTKPK